MRLIVKQMTLPSPYEQNVLGSSTTVAGDWVTKDMHHVVPKLSGAETKLSTSFFVYDGTSSTTEIARKSYALSADGATSTMSVGVLRTDDAAEKSMEPVLQTTVEKTLINCFSGTESNASITTTTLDGSLSWDRDNASLYFGASKKFRISYKASDLSNPAKLAIQALNSTSGLYETRAEFETD